VPEHALSQLLQHNMEPGLAPMCPATVSLPNFAPESVSVSLLGSVEAVLDPPYHRARD
jgi:hypothetical protein